MDQRKTAEQLFKLVQQQGYHPKKPRQLARTLGITSQEAIAEFKQVIKRLVKSGELAYAANHFVIAGPRLLGLPVTGSKTIAGANAAAASRAIESPSAAAQETDTSDEDAPAGASIKSLPTTSGGTARPAKPATPRAHPPGSIVGNFRRMQNGFGFVRPSGTAAGVDRTTDIFIPANRAGDAATGDTVLVRVSKSRSSQRPNREGEIIEIIERETHLFVGTYSEAAGSAYVQVDGTLFARPVVVGDPGAKNAQPDDKVVFEMVRFPSHYHDGEGVITEVLGQRGSPGVDTLSIIHEYNLPGPFAEDALDDARRQADKFDENNLEGRLDLTAETIITIDPVDARDFDDAISLARLKNGHWLLGVHIADVSHFVDTNTSIDREAYNRATSVYLPDRVIPMLPEIISNNLASLQPDRVRYTMSVDIEFTAEGTFVGATAHQAAIKSKRRFTYEEVDEYLADREPWHKKLTPEVHSLLARMHELAMILRARRFQRGALELAMREVKVDLNKQGQVTGAHVVENTESHQIIEEFMLSANEAVAHILHKANILFLRRVHGAPDPRKLKVLTEFVNGLGFRCESLESRFELQRILELVRGRPEQHAVNYATLRSLQRAIYSPEEDGHYALASDCYCHFTSPIRRYPDLTVHRLIKALLSGKKVKNDFGALSILGEHCSDREQRAEAAERELTKLKLLVYLAGHIGQEMDAIVTGVEEFGIFVQGTQLPAEGLVHVTSLQDDYYRFDRATHTLTGNRAGNAFRLGDMVRVTVARVDIDRRELDFRIVDHRQRQRKEDDGGPRRAQRPGRQERLRRKSGQMSSSHIGTDKPIPYEIMPPKSAAEKAVSQPPESRPPRPARSKSSPTRGAFGKSGGKSRKPGGKSGRKKVGLPGTGSQKPSSDAGRKNRRKGKGR